MSQELAQDEGEAEDYEIGALERGGEFGHQPLGQHDEDDDLDEEERKGLVSGGGGPSGGLPEGQTVFDVGGDSDEEGSGSEVGKGRRSTGFRDIDEEEEGSDDGGRKGKGD